MIEYQSIRTALDQRMKALLENADSPELVANTVVKVALSDQPKLRYTGVDLRVD